MTGQMEAKEEPTGAFVATLWAHIEDVIWGVEQTQDLDLCNMLSFNFQAFIK